MSTPGYEAYPTIATPVGDTRCSTRRTATKSEPTCWAGYSRCWTGNARGSAEVPARRRSGRAVECAQVRHGVWKHGGPWEMSGAKSDRGLFERRLHHASLRQLVYEAVRRVSILDGDRVEIELDDRATRG